MFVGALKLDVRILESRSLKDKRVVIRRIKDRTRDRLGLIVSEVGAQELWQRAEVGLAAVSGERRKVMMILDDAARCIAATEGLEILHQWREISGFDGSLDLHEIASSVTSGDAEPCQATSRTASDAATAPLDAYWSPPEWQSMLDEESR
jgi:uncharacterized protein